MNNKTILIYYTYLIIIIGATGYVVFVLDYSGWWFLLTMVFVDISPKNKQNSDTDKESKTSKSKFQQRLDEVMEQQKKAKEK